MMPDNAEPLSAEEFEALQVNPGGVYRIPELLHIIERLRATVRDRERQRDDQTWFVKHHQEARARDLAAYAACIQERDELQRQLADARAEIEMLESAYREKEP